MGRHPLGANVSGTRLAWRLTLKSILRHLLGLRSGGPGGRSAGTSRHGDPRTGSIERAGDGSARAVARGMDYRAAAHQSAFDDTPLERSRATGRTASRELHR